MNIEEKNRIGYREHFYGSDNDSNTKQCFNCKYGKLMPDDREKVQCNKWNMVVAEDDVCDSFEFATYWAFNLTEEDQTRRNMKLENRKKVSAQEGCYIATAVYGGYDEPQVLVLRKYRDEVLKQRFLGRVFIKIYYAISPRMAKKLKAYTRLNEKVRNILDCFVNGIIKKYNKE